MTAGCAARSRSPHVRRPPQNGQPPRPRVPVRRRARPGKGEPARVSKLGVSSSPARASLMARAAAAAETRCGTRTGKTASAGRPAACAAARRCASDARAAHPARRSRSGVSFFDFSRISFRPSGLQHRSSRPNTCFAPTPATTFSSHASADLRPHEQTKMAVMSWPPGPGWTTGPPRRPCRRRWIPRCPGAPTHVPAARTEGSPGAKNPNSSCSRPKSSAVRPAPAAGLIPTDRTTASCSPFAVFPRGSSIRSSSLPSEVRLIMEGTPRTSEIPMASMLPRKGVKALSKFWMSM